jgi:large subunit ribosomal protein L10
LDKTEKTEMVGALSEIFHDAQVGFLVDYRGLNVAAVTELRRRLHEAASQMRVLKNRLAKIAVKGTPYEPLSDHLIDTRALIYGAEPVAPAKVVAKFVEENDKFQLISGILVKGSQGTLLSGAQVKSLGSLPSREELLTQLVFLLNAPQTRFVRTLNEIPARFVRTLAALAEQKAKSAA